MSTLGDLKQRKISLEAKTKKVLAKDIDKYALVKDIAEIVLIGYNAFSGGWIKFLVAVGTAVVKKAADKNGS